MGEPTIELLDNGIEIRGLVVPRQAVGEFLRELPEDERELAFTQALEVGVFCLERASGARDLDFVRRQVEGLLRAVENAVSTLPTQLEEALVDKIGHEDGQVLAPVRGLVERASDTVNVRLKDVRELLEGELDPAKKTSTLGRALSELSELLDADRTDSIQGVLVSTIKDLTGDGGSLSRAVKGCVDEAVKPLAEQIERLGQHFASTVAVEDALSNTTKKGAPYESEIVAEIQRWAAVVGAEVEHVGPDNMSGDVRITLPPVAGTRLVIVVEVRDRTTKVGRKAITETLDKAMAQRGADAAVYVSRTTDGLANEIGDWAEGTCDRGPWLAVTHPYLLIAIRLVAATSALRAAELQIPKVDRGGVEAQLDRVRIALKRIATINSNVTKIRSGASSIEVEAENLRSEVRRALAAADDALRPEGSLDVA